MAKKEPKKAKPKAAKGPEKSELSEDQLEQVAGGASVDMFLKLDGIKGESIDQKQHKEFIAYQATNPLSVKLFKI